MTYRVFLGYIHAYCQLPDIMFSVSLTRDHTSDVHRNASHMCERVVRLVPNAHNASGIQQVQGVAWCCNKQKSNRNGTVSNVCRVKKRGIVRLFKSQKQNLKIDIYYKNIEKLVYFFILILFYTDCHVFLCKIIKNYFVLKNAMQGLRNISKIFNLITSHMINFEQKKIVRVS